MDASSNRIWAYSLAGSGGGVKKPHFWPHPKKGLKMVKKGGTRLPKSVFWPFLKRQKKAKIAYTGNENIGGVQSGDPFLAFVRVPKSAIK